MLDDQNISKVLFQKYICQKLIGKGSFGIVYSGINSITKEHVAIKMEKKDKSKTGTLEAEAFRLIHLQGEGIPKIYCYGSNISHHILIQELLGKSLEELFNLNKKKFSLKTVCVLGIEIMKLIRFVHSKHHIHRDIKPDNFMIGREENENRLYIIDFGLSKKYYSATKKEHIKFSKGKSLTGTARYCARNAHRGYEQSRREDIESIGYLLMYLLLGALPWQGLKLNPGEDHFAKIAEKKYDTSFEELCKGQPNEFVLYFNHVDQLAFEEEPDYNYLIELFQRIINKHCLDCFYDFDWKKDYCNYLPVKKTSTTNKSRNMSLTVNNINGQSTLNQSRNAIENSFNNEEEGKANVFINNDNDCGKDCENNIIVILDDKKNKLNSDNLNNSPAHKSCLKKSNRNNTNKSMSTPKSLNNTQIEKTYGQNMNSRNNKECTLITAATLTNKKFKSIDINNFNISFQKEGINNRHHHHHHHSNNLGTINNCRNDNNNKAKVISDIPNNTKQKQKQIEVNNSTALNYNKIITNNKKEEEMNAINDIKLEVNPVNDNIKDTNKIKKRDKNNNYGKDSTMCKCRIY